MFLKKNCSKIQKSDKSDKIFENQHISDKSDISKKSDLNLQNQHISAKSTPIAALTYPQKRSKLGG